MVDHIVDATAPRGRVEIRSGVGRRRRWSDQDKGRIVAQSYASGAVVSEVARRYEISPQHLFAWRKAARAGLLTLPGEEGAMSDRHPFEVRHPAFVRWPREGDMARLHRKHHLPSAAK